MKSLPCPLPRLAGGQLMPVAACLFSPALPAATATTQRAALQRAY